VQFPKYRPPSPRLTIPFERQTYRGLWKELRLYAPFWGRYVWDPDSRLALKALQKGSAQKIRELHQLIRFLRNRTLETIVEVGTGRGGTLYALCQLANDRATIVSIDLPGGAFGGGYTEKEVELFRTYGKAGQELYFIRRDSHDETTRDELLRVLREKAIDFLMIDGDHSYEGVKSDFNLYSPLVSEHGLVAFHDILVHPRSPKCEVHIFWSEIKSDRAVSEIVDTYDDAHTRGQWGGIGVLEWHR
jgi:predicted O-methyltransferase YrrM